MTFEEKEEYLEEKNISKIFGTQKVRLYKIKHFIFDFGGVMVEKSFTVKNLFDVRPTIAPFFKVIVKKSCVF